MSKLLLIIAAAVLMACQDPASKCQEPSEPYWSTTLMGKPHRTRISGENRTLRRAFSQIRESETHIVPEQGWITLKLHLDKDGHPCQLETFQIGTDYNPVVFNEGLLLKRLESVAMDLNGWTNDTNTKTYYLIRFKIKDGRIAEIF